MAVDERARHQLHTRLEEILGADPATTLMSYLPPVGWADVATKRDLDQLADRFDAALHREIGALRGAVDTRFDSLRRGFDSEAVSLRSEVGSLRGESERRSEALRRELGSLGSEFERRSRAMRSESEQRFDALRSEFAAQTRTLLLGTGALMLSIATLAFAALQLT